MRKSALLIFLLLLTSHFTFAQTLSCSNWLYTSANPSAISLGDLDVSGTQITVEANINSIAVNPGGRLYAGDIVSKHTGPTNTNYLLRPNSAEITTSNGYFITPQICDIKLNQTYHVAMVYDGATLKFYRDGYLMSQTNATGTLFQNDFDTRIGLFTLPLQMNEQFNGYINEVRIWNVARTQSQIQTYMNAVLPNPTNQTGLMANYTFNDLLNKQGNAARNGTIVGSASINATNPQCSFVRDSCAVAINSIVNGTSISGIINNYTPVIDLLSCKNKITVTDGTAYNAGDTVLLIQMKGAVVDSSNTASFGNILSYNNCGNYEYNYVKQRVGNVVELKNALTHSYDVPTGKVQLIRVPYYTSATVSASLTCLPWDGTVGGVLALNVRDTLYMNADIDVSGKGFRKGIVHNSKINEFTCNLTNYFYPINTIYAAGKGESIADLSDNKNAGWGAKASGGGGGMDPNTGGGGGGNGNIGGKGGYGYADCPNYNTAGGWGLGGNSLTYNNQNNKIFMGGAGGAGHCNNGFNDPLVNTDFNGGNGGGIIVLSSNVIKANSNSIKSNGDTAYELTGPGYLAHDGMGGGGAGGTILIKSASFANNLNIKAIGGKGGNMSSSTSGGRVGPGGGGGGGVIWLATNNLPANVSIQKSGGLNGVILQDNNNPYGATAGLDGITVNNLAIPIDTELVKNIDSVRFTALQTSCSNFDFKGFAYPTTVSVASWQWTFGDGSFSNTQNTSHNYTNANLYQIKLKAFTLSGCTDSFAISVPITPLTVDAGNDTVICHNAITQLHGIAIGGKTYSWAPAQYLNDSTILNPIANITKATKFYLFVKSSSGCITMDSVNIAVKPVPTFSINPNTGICTNASTQLLAKGGTYYQWSPAQGLSNSFTANPIATPLQTTVYTAAIKDSACNDTATLNTTVTVFPNPVFTATSANDIDCSNGQSQLTASNTRLQYLWSPSDGLNNPNVYNPIAAPVVTTTYSVIGKDQNGCTDSSTVLVNVSQNGKSGYYMPNAFTPNGDGKNDCFGIKSWGQINSLQFTIYNRFGQKVFYTENPSGCWDGNFNGQQQPSDNYVYHIKAITICGNIDKSGSVILMR